MSTVTDRQGPKKGTQVRFSWSHLATASDRPPAEMHQTYHKYATSGQGHITPPVSPLMPMKRMGMPIIKIVIAIMTPTTM